jgi:hypothetical protein
MRPVNRTVFAFSDFRIATAVLQILIAGNSIPSERFLSLRESKLTIQ